MPTRYIAFFNPGEPTLHIPFLAPAGKELYEFDFVGVWIDEVIADGEAIKPHTGSIFDLHDDRAASFDAPVVYQMRSYPDETRYPNTWVVKSGGEQFLQTGDLRRFLIPRSTKLIEIRYRVCCADGEYGPPSIVELHRVRKPGMF